MVGIFGIGGQGKTALAAALVHTLSNPPPFLAAPRLPAELMMPTCNQRSGLDREASAGSSGSRC